MMYQQQNGNCGAGQGVGLTVHLDSVRVCIDFLPPGTSNLQVAEAAARAASQQIPAMASLPEPFDISALQPSYIALLKAKKWQYPKTLRVAFLGGLPSVQARVQQHAKQWSDLTSISFEFGADPSAAEL